MTINETINSTIDLAVNNTATVLGYTAPFTSNPIIDIYLITLVTSLFITLVNKYLSDQTAIKALRLEMKESQKEMRAVMKKDPKKAQKMQQAHMKKSFEMMKHTMNPKVMITTMIPILVVFSYIRTLYGPLGGFFNVFGITTFGWLGTYILFSLINSIVLKKVLDVA